MKNTASAAWFPQPVPLGGRDQRPQPRAPRPRLVGPKTDGARHARMSAAEFHEVMRRAFDRAREGRRLSSQQLGIAVSGPLASSA